MQETNISPRHEGSGYLPFDYLVDFLRFLHRNRDLIEIFTYDDLEWDDDYSPDTMYRNEYSNWIKRTRKGPNRKKIHVLLQHDVDSVPEQSMKTCELEYELGIPSNIMLFNKRIDRSLLKQEGRLRFTEYPLDDTLLERSISENFVVGYHSNAYEQSGFEMNTALEIFESDLVQLRDRFTRIAYFSPHGGVPGPDGRNNHSLEIGEEMQRRLQVRWVHNRRSLSFHKNYSDGGFNNANRNRKTLDMLNFVKCWRPGKRYRLLIHPQYYGSVELSESGFNRAPNVTGTAWYDRVLDLYSTQNGSNEPNDPIWGRLRYSRFRRRFVEC